MDFPVDLTDIKVKKNFIEVVADTCMQFLLQFLKLCAEEKFILFTSHFPTSTTKAVTIFH